jgi:hypothetical protein
MAETYKGISEPYTVFFPQVRRMARGNAEFWAVFQERGSL